MRIAALALAVVAAALPLSSAADERSLELGGVGVVVWMKAQAESPMPVVVFSHGIGLCATQARFLTEALSGAGYLVVAPNHRDSHCEKGAENTDPSGFALKPSRLWTDGDYRDRANDVEKVVAALSHDERLRAYADLSRVALVGHSLGGYTVLGLGGAWPAWTLPGVKAIVALSPYSAPFRSSGGLRKLRAPVMYQGGTLDLAFTPPLRGRGGAFEQSPPPKYYVEIESAAHFAWTDGSLVAKEMIVAYALAFLDRYVRDMPEASLLRTKAPGVADFRRNAK